MKKQIIKLMLASFLTLSSAWANQIFVNGQSVNRSFSSINSVSRVSTFTPQNGYVKYSSGNNFNRLNTQTIRYSNPGTFNNFSNQSINIQNQIRVRNF
jgi:hypothetical protein